mmetsp:Transcript_93781/g.270976  ORF Transcript_93781/g.270976 Transcript_93781/m.270976 type:complete len:296 (-) Transcript_93781:315-1202(-)
MEVRHGGGTPATASRLRLVNALLLLRLVISQHLPSPLCQFDMALEKPRGTSLRVEVSLREASPRADTGLCFRIVDLLILGLFPLARKVPESLQLHLVAIAQTVQVIQVDHLLLLLVGGRLLRQRLPIDVPTPVVAQRRLEFRDVERAGAILVQALQHLLHIGHRQVQTRLLKHGVDAFRVQRLVAPAGAVRVGRVVGRVPEQVLDPRVGLVQQLGDGRHCLHAARDSPGGGHPVLVHHLRGDCRRRRAPPMLPGLLRLGLVNGPISATAAELSDGILELGDLEDAGAVLVQDADQ